MKGIRKFDINYPWMNKYVEFRINWADGLRDRLPELTTT